MAVLSAQAAPALDHFHREGWDIVQPVSLAYDADLCALWVAQERPELVLVTPSGRELRRFDTGFSRVRAVTVEGDTVIAGDGWGTFQRYDRHGRAIGGTFTPPAGMRDIEGVHLDPDGTMFFVGDDPAFVVALSPDGLETLRIDGETLEPPLREPQGIARDPVSGNLLVIDDNEGLNAIFEMTAAGELLSVTPLSDWGRDAEAVALQPQTGQMFIGFDWSQRVEVFDWLPTRSSIPDEMDLGPPCPVS